MYVNEGSYDFLFVPEVQIILHGIDILNVFQIKSHETSWPFREPVNKNKVPDYYDHIKYPMGIDMN